MFIVITERRPTTSIPDAISQRSMSSCDYFENLPSSHSNNVGTAPATAPVISTSSNSITNAINNNNSGDKVVVTRRSFGKFVFPSFTFLVVPVFFEGQQKYVSKNKIGVSDQRKILNVLNLKFMQIESLPLFGSYQPPNDQI